MNPGDKIPKRLASEPIREGVLGARGVAGVAHYRRIGRSGWTACGAR